MNTRSNSVSILFYSSDDGLQQLLNQLSFIIRRLQATPIISLSSPAIHLAQVLLSCWH